VTELSFGPAGFVDASLSEGALSLVGSEILKIAAEIRAMVASGKSVCNLTSATSTRSTSRFRPSCSRRSTRPWPGERPNYPPSDGMLVLRQAAAELTARECGVRYPVDSVLIASGARRSSTALTGAWSIPATWSSIRRPSWNNNHYCVLTRAKAVAVATHAEDGFQPTLEAIRPHLGEAQLIVLNTPLNPTGTVIAPEHLRAIAQAVVDENAHRTKVGRRHVFLLFDQVYGSLTFGSVRHDHPVALVPESAPWVITVDGISKALASTGLRVGWLLAAPELTARMRDLIGHVGAWAPRAEQVATAKFLQNAQAVSAFRKQMNASLAERLDALHAGFSAMKADGYRVHCIQPQGAIYLSLCLDVVGKHFGDRLIDGNETIRKVILEEAGLAAVPFQAFGLMEETGWFRLSVGAVSMDEIAQMFPRLRSLLDRVK
jgi:aspartate aminotransferase